ncbi:hypothetical protein EX30DRAFT_367107 [Ascodesmis nigricans]|uniref:Uncharacterized protein n=1 Tax=Ascodesmis nigricans TaxID=341454 RepID=A0A4S2MIQ4_9PEZI|nr:hypothetical protein EX30DRAFT_367107 [Ascodesmis nigricans]
MRHFPHPYPPLLRLSNAAAPFPDNFSPPFAHPDYSSKLLLLQPTSLLFRTGQNPPLPVPTPDWRLQDWCYHSVRKALRWWYLLRRRGVEYVVNAADKVSKLKPGENDVIVNLRLMARVLNMNAQMLDIWWPPSLDQVMAGWSDAFVEELARELEMQHCYRSQIIDTATRGERIRMAGRSFEIPIYQQRFLDIWVPPSQYATSNMWCNEYDGVDEQNDAWGPQGVTGM